jgi:hypothetical protein
MLQAQHNVSHCQLDAISVTDCGQGRSGLLAAAGNDDLDD